MFAYPIKLPLLVVSPATSALTTTTAARLLSLCFYSMQAGDADDADRRLLKRVSQHLLFSQLTRRAVARRAVARRAVARRAVARPTRTPYLQQLNSTRYDRKL